MVIKMGLYDNISVFMECPYCGHMGMINAQTKDLGQNMFHYKPIDMHKYVLWKSQRERALPMAKVPKEFEKKKYITVVGNCNSAKCQFDGDRHWIIIQGTPSGFPRHFEGKIKIKNGYLTGIIYDIEKDDLTERKLCRYKVKYKKLFNKLMKIYKHEPFVCRNWRRKLK